MTIRTATVRYMRFKLLKTLPHLQPARPEASAKQRLKSLTRQEIRNLKDKDIASLTAEEVKLFSARQLNDFTARQIEWFNAGQIMTLVKSGSLQKRNLHYNQAKRFLKQLEKLSVTQYLAALNILLGEN